MATRMTYVLASAVFVLAVSTHEARAQEPTRVQGLVTNDARQPLAGVSVGISTLGVRAIRTTTERQIPRRRVATGEEVLHVVR